MASDLEGLGVARVDENGYNNPAGIAGEGISVLFMGSSHAEGYNVLADGNAARLLDCRRAAGEEIDRAGFAALAGENPCCTASQLSIDGRTLARMGAKGAQIGQLLHKLLDEVIDGQTPNTSPALAARAAALLAKPLP